MGKDKEHRCTSVFSFGFCAETFFFGGEDGAVLVYLPVSQFRGSIRTLGTCWMMRNASIHPGPKSAHLDVSRSSSAGRRSALFSQVVLTCRLKWGGGRPPAGFPCSPNSPATAPATAVWRTASTGWRPPAGRATCWAPAPSTTPACTSGGPRLPPAAGRSPAPEGA